MKLGRITFDMEEKLKQDFKKMCKSENIPMGQALRFMMIKQVKKGTILKEVTK